MRRRNGASLDAGALPQMRGQNLRLVTVVLQRADGRDAPALAEMETQMHRRGMPRALVAASTASLTQNGLYTPPRTDDASSSIPPSAAIGLRYW